MQDIGVTGGPTCDRMPFQCELLFITWRPAWHASFSYSNGLLIAIIVTCANAVACHHSILLTSPSPRIRVLVPCMCVDRACVWWLFRLIFAKWCNIFVRHDI